MNVLGVIIFLVLMGILGWLFIKFGMVNVDPVFVMIRRNVVNGNLKELGPGLKFFIPGLYENFQMVDCRQVILDPDILPVTTRDGQPVNVDYQITLWVDAFDEKKKIKPGQAIKAATVIGEQKTASEEEKFKGNMEVIGEKESNVAIQNMIANYQLGELVSTNTDAKDAKKVLRVSCPNCGGEIPEDKNVCQNAVCTKNNPEKSIPAGFFERLSWSAGITLNDFLAGRYGLGCFLKIRNVKYPQDTEKAARAKKIAEMEGAATKARLAQETDAIADLITKTKANPNIALLGIKAVEAFGEMLGFSKNKRERR